MPWDPRAAVAIILPNPFGSIALIYLGRSLYHDRREILARLLRVPLPAPVYAGAIDRSFAYAIDFLLLTPALTVLLQYLGVAITTLVGWDAAVLLGMFGEIQFVYFFVMELTIGQSIGKRIIGIRVQQADGRRVGVVGAFVRNVVRILDASGCTGILGFLHDRVHEAQTAAGRHPRAHRRRAD